MKVSPAFAEGTRARLIQAAERLFAAHGPAGVSLRAVMHEANTNVAAVHYHFGSKESLVEAVVRGRIADITREREAVLAQSASAGRMDARALANSLVEPVRLLVENGGRDWVRLIGHLLTSNDPGLAPVADTFFERNARFLELLEELDSHASSDALNFRVTQAMAMTLRVLGDGENVQSLLSGKGTPWSMDDIVEQLVDVVTSILAGPPSDTEHTET